jgi:hypothetical protein
MGGEKAGKGGDGCWRAGLDQVHEQEGWGVVWIK